MTTIKLIKELDFNTRNGIETICIARVEGAIVGYDGSFIERNEGETILNPYSGEYCEYSEEVEENISIGNNKYFLFGSEFVDEYNNNGIKSLAPHFVNDTLTGEVFKYTPHIGSSILYAFDGWGKFQEISVEDYEFLMNFQVIA